MIYIMFEMSETDHQVMNPPNELSMAGDIADNWRKWKGHFLLFLETLTEKDDDIRTSIFLQTVGNAGLKIYNSFHWERDDDRNIMNKVLEKFDAYCYPRTSVIYERYQFNMRCQRDREGIDDYVVELRNMARKCEYGTQTENLIRDRVICGIHDDKVRSSLLQDENLCLETAIELCRSGERESLLERRLVEMTSPRSSSEVKVVGEQVSGKRSFRAYCSISSYDLMARMEIQTSDNPMKTAAADKKLPLLCHNCDGRHKRFEQCPAFGIICTLCKKRNHFAKVCKRQILKKRQFKIPRGSSIIHELKEEID